MPDNIEYGDTYYFPISFSVLPYAYAIGTKNIVPSHIFFSPGVFVNGSAAYNSVIGYRIYALDGFSKDTDLGALANYQKLINIQQLKWCSVAVNPSLYIPWNRPLCCLIEFYGATLPGLVTGDFCIRSIKQR